MTWKEFLLKILEILKTPITIIIVIWVLLLMYGCSNLDAVTKKESAFDMAVIKIIPQEVQECAIVEEEEEEDTLLGRRVVDALKGVVSNVTERAEEVSDFE